jgi:hypothetical protein
LTDDPLPADFDDDDLPALSFYGPDAESAASDFDALGGYEDDEEVVATMFTVTNPPGTVTVSTLMDGSVQRIDLSQEVISMTEADLADEIVVIARLATQDARAAQYVHVLDGMRQQGHDDAATRDFLSRDLDLPSPEDASAARARVFATRYAGDHE